MAATSTSLLLVLLAAQVWSWENLPSIPAGRRAEYYLQHDDGAYKFGYDTGAGQSARADADAANEVRGRYQYVDAAGRQVALQYTAGQAGFVPAAPGGGLGNGAASGIASVRTSSPARDSDGQVDADYDANADASYNFNIDTDSYKRTESADARGNIRGQYSYSSAEGGSHGLSYVAGDGTGFVVTGGDAGVGVPLAAAAPYSGPLSNAEGVAGPDGAYSFSYSGDGQSRQESADAQNNVRGSYSFTAKDDGKTRRVDYRAGAATGFVASGDHLPVAPASDHHLKTAALPSYPGPGSNAQSAINPDGSYSFSFNGDGQTRDETADAQNNVRGSYSFRAKDDGQTRRVDYQAGSSTGFVASGAHLPVAPVAPGGSAASPAPASPYNAPASLYSSAPATSSSQGALNTDGSYSYSFSTGDQSRQESADAQNNVRGSYSFKAKDDGQTRRVDYEAGASTGFVASGAHLPVAPVVPGGAATSTVPASPYNPPASLYSSAPAASSSQGALNTDGSYSYSFSTDEQSRQESADAKNNVRGSYSFKAKDDGQTRRVDYQAGSSTGFVASGAHLPVAPGGAAASPVPASPYNAPANLYSSVPAASSSQGALNTDGSYSYSFSTGDQTRQESADAKNNVRGSYSFKAKDDGKTRRVDYEAGSETGFVARGDHLPVAPSVSSGPTAFVSSYSSPGPAVPASSSSAGGSNADGSYAFSYSTDQQSRQEAADAHNNVRGSYSFKAKDDGKTRRVDYEAGAATGFVARGDHLSVAPKVPGSSVDSGVATLSAYSLAGSSGASKRISDPAAASDGSYSFSYGSDDQSREEASDSKGNVRGRFSFKAKDDGKTRTVDYEAGAEKGFIAKGAHLPVAVSPGAYSPVNTHQAPAPVDSGSYQDPSEDGSESSQNSGDASYSYSYQTDTSSKTESSDAQGNVQGEFSYVGGDGVTRNLKYTSRGKAGFVAGGEHLPKPVPASAAFGSASTIGAAASGGSLQNAAVLGAGQHARATSGFVLNKYLPPESPHKFGYIFDTKV